MRRLRLLKVIVQPVFVIDDEVIGLVESPAQPVVVPAQEWPTYATNRFAREFAALEEEVARGGLPGQPLPPPGVITGSDSAE